MSTAVGSVTSSGRGLGGAVRGAFPLLVGIGLLLVGSGLTATMLGVRAGLEGFRPGVIGIVLAGYYLGYVGGSYFAPPAIQRVGHVRVFAGLAALASAAVLIHLVFVDPLSWFVLRVIVGMSVSGLYVVCETWLNGVATNRSRGSLFAIYMIVVSGALLGGQFVYAIIGAKGFEPFVIASVLVSLAVVPVSLAVFPSISAPRPEPIAVRTIFRIAPLAIVSTSLSGFVGAAMLSAGVVFAAQSGFNRSATGAFVGSALAGGVLLQLPLGAWSDRVDRRLVLAATAAAGLLVSLAASQVSTDQRLVLIAMTLVAGGAAFPIYSLGVAHLNDYIDDDIQVAAGSKIVLVNGIGAVAGPVAGSFAIGQTSPSSLFLVIAVAYFIVLADSLFRMTRRSAAEEEARARFVPVVVGVGPMGVMGGDPDEDERFPVFQSGAAFGELVVHVRERGAGPAVVLIGDVAGSRGDVWDGLLGPLAADGFRVIAPSLGEDNDPDEAFEAVVSVLRHLVVRSATFVGFGSGADLVVRLVEDHADRVDAFVLLAAPGEFLDFNVELEVGVPVLVLDEAALAVDPSDVADDIAEFIRPIAATIALHWETGQPEEGTPEEHQHEDGQHAAPPE